MIVRLIGFRLPGLESSLHRVSRGLFGIFVTMPAVPNTLRDTASLHYNVN